MKTIVIISGENELKTKFNEVAKENGYWIWNVSHMNYLSVMARQLGWNGERNKHYRNFINGLEGLSSEYFSFPRNYVRKMIAKFYSDEKANLLIIHGCDPEYAKEIRHKDDTWAVYLTNKEPDEPSAEYDKVIIGSENFTNDVITVLSVLSNNN